MKNIFNFDLRQREKTRTTRNAEMQRMQKRLQKTISLSEQKEPNSTCAVATSPISKVAKSFVCSAPCCRATKHDQVGETGRSTTAQQQENATQKTPSKISRHKMQHDQVILKYLRHHISYQNTSLHRSLLGLVTLEYFWICRKILGAKVFLLHCHVPVMLSCPEM